MDINAIGNSLYSHQTQHSTKSDIAKFAALLAGGSVSLDKSGAANAVADAEDRTGVSATSAGDETAAVGQTLEVFKAEFYRLLDAIPIHPSQAQSRISISIDDAAFEKMMNDPALKEELLGVLTRDLGANMVTTPAFSTHRIDADGEYTATAGGGAYSDYFEKESGDAFWRREPSSVEKEPTEMDKRKAKKKKEREQLEELLAEIAAGRKAMAAVLQENYHQNFSGKSVDPYAKTTLVTGSGWADMLMKAM